MKEEGGGRKVEGGRWREEGGGRESVKEEGGGRESVKEACSPPQSVIRTVYMERLMITRV